MVNGKPVVSEAEPWQMEMPRRYGQASSIFHFPFSIIHSPRTRHAFTLTEVLVTLGIIILIVGLLLPAVLKAYRTGIKTRTLDDLHLIETALDAYKQDFGDYPRFASPADDQTSAAAGTFGNGTWLDYRQDRGAMLLCRALIGPGPGPDPANPNMTFHNGEDGNNGPGFRTRRNISIGAGGVATAVGKVYGPYVQPDKFNLGGTDKTNFTDAVILDRWNNPILYYPATPGAQITQANNGSFVDSSNPTAPNPVPPLYNAFDNTGYGTTATTPYLSKKQMQYILGDRQNNGYIVSGESAVTTQPYLLWTAGADGAYGFGNDPATGAPRVPPFAGLKTDDVTNFDMPSDLQR